MTILVWNHKFHFYKPISVIKYPVNDCCICRSKLSSLCINCQYDDGSRLIHSINTKDTLFTLLAMQKNKECPFFKIDKMILSKIYMFCVQNELANSITEHNCKVLELPCGHFFHRHCFSLWIRKRNLCPLDNNTDTLPINIFDTRVKNVCDVSLFYKNDTPGGL